MAAHFCDARPRMTFMLVWAIHAGLHALVRGSMHPHDHGTPGDTQQVLSSLQPQAPHALTCYHAWADGSLVDASRTSALVGLHSVSLQCWWTEGSGLQLMTSSSLAGLHCKRADVPAGARQRGRRAAGHAERWR